jgi:PAS domain S-box-containing protein
MVGANRLADPEVGAILLSLRDITNRRRWELASDQTARFRSLVHHVASLIMLVSAEGVVETASGVLTRLLGLDQELVEGRPFAELVDPADAGDLASALARALDAPSWQSVPTTVELRLVRADGVSVPFELSLVNLVDDPTVEGVVVSGHDVSQLWASRAALVRQERLSAVGEMATVIGHELRNPLGAAINLLYITRSRLADHDDPELNVYLDRLEHETNRAVSLCEDLTAYMREREPVIVALDFGAVVADVIESTPPPVGIEVALGDLGVEVQADRALLVQMLTNLITNAYQAMPDGGSITVSGSESDGWVQITVADSGAGIDPADAELFFDPFYTTKATGTGLGLAIVKRFAEGHHGTVSIENALAGGARVTLRLPHASAGVTP